MLPGGICSADSAHRNGVRGVSHVLYHWQRDGGVSWAFSLALSLEYPRRLAQGIEIWR